MFFVFVAICVITALIYFLYKLMLGIDTPSKNVELQISSQGILEQIIILRKQKQYNIVEKLALKYLAKKPKDDEVRIILAKTLFEAKKTYDAVDQLKIILKHQPENSDMKIFLANCYTEVETPMKAVNILEDVLDEDCNNIVAMNELANLYFLTNQKLSAVKIYKMLDEFIDNNPEKVKNKRKVAEIYVDFKDYDAAINEYYEILNIYPDDINTKKRLIELYKLSSDFDSLIEAAKEMVSTADSESVIWALERLVEVYQITKNYETALEYARLIQNHPLSDEIDATYKIARILLEDGQIEESIEIFKALVKKDTSNIELKKSLAGAYIINKDYDSAVNIYKIILDMANLKDIEKIHSELSYIHSSWGIYLFGQNNNDECFKHFTIALKYYDKNPEIYYQLGEINRIIKNYNEAISQYKKAIELNPKSPSYYYALADCYEEIESIYEQKKVLLESLNYETKNAEVYYKLGGIYEMQDDYATGISNLKKAIELYEDYSEAKYKLALMLEHSGNIEEAISLYENILRLEPENQEVSNNLKMLKG